MRTISVAMCACNRQAFIGDSLAAIARQTRRPDELVVADDVSTDDTRAIVRAFARSAPFPVRLLTHEGPHRLGSKKNYERAIAACQGELIALCDDDDVWLPHKLEAVERPFAEGPSSPLLMFSDAVIVDDRLRPLNRRLWAFKGFAPTRRDAAPDHALFRHLLRGNPSYTSTIAFRADFRPMALPLPTTWVQDWWLTTLAAALGQASWLEDALILYRQHTTNISGAKPRSAVAQWRKARLDNLAQYYQHIQQTEDLRERLRRLSPPNARDLLALLDDRIAHYRRRIDLRDHGRFHRLGLVARQLRAGGYHRFDLGVKSAVKDAFFP